MQKGYALVTAVRDAILRYIAGASAERRGNLSSSVLCAFTEGVCEFPIVDKPRAFSPVSRPYTLRVALNRTCPEESLDSCHR